MGTDVLTEMMVGAKGAVRCIGKFVLSPRGEKVDGLPLVMIIGAAVSPEGGKLVLPENDGFNEMWECEIILIPHRKYSPFEKPPKNEKEWPQKGFPDHRADQILCGRYGDPEAWGRKYFDAKEPTGESSDSMPNHEA